MACDLPAPLRGGLNRLAKKLRRRYRGLDEQDISAALGYACECMDFGFCPTFSTILQVLEQRATEYCDAQTMLRTFLRERCGEEGAALLEEIAYLPAAARAAFHQQLTAKTGGLIAWLNSQDLSPATALELVRATCWRVQPPWSEGAVPIERAIGQTRKRGSHRGPP